MMYTLQSTHQIYVLQEIAIINKDIIVVGCINYPLAHVFYCR